MIKPPTFEEAKANLFDETELTIEEVDEILRNAGFDPKAIGRRMASAARQALEKLRRKNGLQL